jgi:hypothetical protein
MSTKAKIAAGLILGALAALAIYQLTTAARLRAENQALREKLSELEQLRTEKENHSSVSQSSGDQLTDQESRELARLRGQVAALKRQLAEANQARVANAARDTQPAVQPAHDGDAGLPNQESIHRMRYGKGLVYSLIAYADAHQGQFPEDLDLAARFRPADVTTDTNLLADQFELLYQGKYDDLTNTIQVIVVREREPWLNSRGQWTKTYGFADGHSEVHTEINGDFEMWESERLPQNFLKPR